MHILRSRDEPLHMSFQREYDEDKISKTKGITGTLFAFLFNIYLLFKCKKKKQDESFADCDEIDGKNCCTESNNALERGCGKSSTSTNISNNTCEQSMDHKINSTHKSDGAKIIFRHHAVILPHSPKTFWRYQSNGDFSNLFQLMDIAHYGGELINTENEDQMKSFEFQKGIYLNIYSHANKREVGQRAEECRTLLAIPYYSFASLNCENIATFLMRGVGNSKQLEEMSKAMWALTDIMDFYVTFYKEFFLILFAMCTLSTEACFLMEAFFIGYILQRENAHLAMRIKEEKYSARQMLKYAGSFILRYNLYLFLSLCSFGIGAHILNVILFICLPPFLGYCYNSLKLCVLTTYVYKILREI